jgi:hypothetical protein
MLEYLEGSDEEKKAEVGVMGKRPGRIGTGRSWVTFGQDFSLED